MKRKISLLVAALIMLSTVVVNAETAPDAVTAPTTKVETPTTTPKPATPPAATPAPTNGQVYTVVKGDTMYGIARKYKLTINQLKALNPQIKNINLIYPGNKVVVNAVAPVPTTPANTNTTTLNTTKLYQGLGQTLAFRNGPGKDSTGVPVYSFTIVMADATFDADGKIVNAYLDAYEVSTPNYDGASMPHFSGWPGTPGYNVTDHQTEKVTGVSTNTLDSATAEVNGWQTKRQRGDSYGMNPANEWYKQMNFYQKFFVGKTIADLDAWFAKNTTSAGRPIKANTTNQDDLNKLAKLTDAEKTALADVVAGATMSLRDPHGDFLGALENAYKNRVEVALPTK